MNIFLIRSSEAFRTRELPRRPTVHLCSRRPFSLVSRPTVHRKPFFSKAHTPKIGILTDSNVPEGHQGLHDALYGEQGAEIHESRRYMFRKGEDEGEVMLPIDEYLTSRDGERPLGVYAVYDQQRSVQYIGFTRNVVLSLKKHRAKLGPEICAFVRAMVFMNKAMTTREILEREALDWIEREGTFPPGNGAERELWEDEDTLTINNMSEKERIEYEEQRNKFRKAMGANLHDDVPGESLESKERRLRLIKAVEGDNWSAVIDEQTNGTILKQDTTTPAGIISPFAQAPIHRSVGNSANLTDVEMDMTSVDKALDEVRPYLISDGGNVEVVNVEDGNVFLRLQGACGKYFFVSTSYSHFRNVSFIYSYNENGD